MKLLGILFLSVFACLPLSAAEDGFRPLFNGKDLAGWDGNPELWSVQDGAITGKTTGQAQLKYNQFLIWRGGKVKNFELRLKVKHQGNNTGVQYRSRELPENGTWSIGGYQCDMHPNPPYNAMVYDERGRGIITQNGQRVVIDPQGQKWVTEEHEPVKVDPSEWHDYTIIANGNHLIHQIDGKVTIDLTDHEEKARSLEGLLAFQIHQGAAMTVQIKDVMLKDLPDGGLIAFNQISIPSDAQLIQPPGAKPKAAPVPAAAVPAEPAKPKLNDTPALKPAEPEKPKAAPEAEKPKPKPTPEPEKPTEVAKISFEKDVLPIFKAKCTKCHGDSGAKGGVDLRTLKDTVGFGVKPGDLKGSMVWQSIADGSMPPSGNPKVSEAEKKTISQWITSGAK